MFPRSFNGDTSGSESSTVGSTTKRVMRARRSTRPWNCHKNVFTNSEKEVAFILYFFAVALAGIETLFDRITKFNIFHDKLRVNSTFLSAVGFFRKHLSRPFLNFCKYTIWNKTLYYKCKTFSARRRVSVFRSDYSKERYFIYQIVKSSSR